MSGAALDFDITSVQLFLCCRNTNALYARGLASAKMHKIVSNVGGEEVHCLVNGIAAACMLLEICLHVASSSSLRVISQSICGCQSV